MPCAQGRSVALVRPRSTERLRVGRVLDLGAEGVMVPRLDTPDEVREQVGRLRSVPGLSRVIVFPQVPDAGFMAREAILTMFADEVMARVRA